MVYMHNILSYVLHMGISFHFYVYLNKTHKFQNLMGVDMSMGMETRWISVWYGYDFKKRV